MSRSSALPVLALVLVVACQDSNSPDRARPNVAGPSFQEAPPSDAECATTLVDPLTGTFQNVTVPPGEQCVLHNSTLTGNLKALEGSILVTLGNSIAGNIQADKATAILLNADVVGGNIDIVGTRGEGVNVSGVTVLKGNIHVIKNAVEDISISSNILDAGSIKVEDNGVFPVQFGGSFHVTGNSTPRNIQVYKNSGGTQAVTGNIAGQIIQCFENVTGLAEEPFVGGPNTAPQAEGQCSATPPLP